MKTNPNAVFHGGSHGGHFFELVNINNNKYRFKIYRDYNENLVIEAIFKKDENNCSLIFDDKNIHNYISHYDDKKIQLYNDKKGCRLILDSLIYDWNR
ncbi:MAG: hypothetical protein IAE65_03245 [Ignavibacteria bacterium]|nr:hypothetical protein [Ignavibacteria bacterium]